MLRSVLVFPNVEKTDSFLILYKTESPALRGILFLLLAVPCRAGLIYDKD